jgi:hypothetical protein
MKITQTTLKQLIAEEYAKLTEEPSLEEDYEHLNPAGKARLDARARIRKMATDLFATADALAEVGLDDLSDKVKAGSKMLRALHLDLGEGRNLGDV